MADMNNAALDTLLNILKTSGADAWEVTDEEEKGWEFVFLGANIDAAEAAGSIGIRSENAVDYHADCCGTEMLYEAVGCAVSSIRSKKGISKSWKRSVEADNMRRKKA